MGERVLPYLRDQVLADSQAVRPDGYVIIQSLAIYNNDNFPSSIKMPKKVQKFAKKWNKPSKNLPEDF